MTDVIVLVVDDQDNARAAELRAELGASLRHVGANLLAEVQYIFFDRATWHPMDLRVVLVPASSPSIDGVFGPPNDARLAWTTHQATSEDLDALVAATEEAVQAFRAQAGASFRPLERARDIVALLKGRRAPANDVEANLLDSTATSRPSRTISVAFVVATDDESPDSASSYWFDADPYETRANVVTFEGRGGTNPDPTHYPRFAAWMAGQEWTSFGGCHDEAVPSVKLFGEHCVDYRGRCDGHSIAQLSPGLGACNIEITTIDPPTCEASRGWADPLDADGVRRPRLNDQRQRVCEMLPVDPSHMDACIHDETCADCGSGWCVTEVLPVAARCGPGTQPMPLRWAGGALPDPGGIHVVCREPD